MKLTESPTDSASVRSRNGPCGCVCTADGTRRRWESVPASAHPTSLSTDNCSDASNVIFASNGFSSASVGEMTGGNGETWLKSPRRHLQGKLNVTVGLPNYNSQYMLYIVCGLQCHSKFARAVSNWRNIDGLGTNRGAVFFKPYGIKSGPFQRWFSHRLLQSK